MSVISLYRSSAIMKENEDVILKSDEPFSIKFLASAVCTKGLYISLKGDEKSVEILRIVLVLYNECIGLKKKSSSQKVRPSSSCDPVFIDDFCHTIKAPLNGFSASSLSKSAFFHTS